MKTQQELYYKRLNDKIERRKLFRASLIKHLKKTQDYFCATINVCGIAFLTAYCLVALCGGIVWTGNKFLDNKPKIKTIHVTNENFVVYYTNLIFTNYRWAKPTYTNLWIEPVYSNKVRYFTNSW